VKLKHLCILVHQLVLSAPIDNVSRKEADKASLIVMPNLDNLDDHLLFISNQGHLHLKLHQISNIQMISTHIMALTGATAFFTLETNNLAVPTHP
jgi:hypothetical protein